MLQLYLFRIYNFYGRVALFFSTYRNLVYLTVLHRVRVLGLNEHDILFLVRNDFFFFGVGTSKK